MFRGHVFLAASNVPQDVRVLVAACGGRIVSRLEAAVTFGLVAVASLEELRGSLACEEELRGLRIPIVRTSWIRASVAAGHMVPVKFPHAVYDPSLLEAFHFTTVLVPTALEANVVAVMQFFGGTYSPQLTAKTNLLVYDDTYMSGYGNIPSEIAVAVSMESVVCELWKQAIERDIPCVSVEWLHKCITMQRLLPPPQSPLRDESVDLNFDAAAATNEDRENSHGSLQDAAINSRMDLVTEVNWSPQRCCDNRDSKADESSSSTELISLSKLRESILDGE
ncbi:BRCT domain [Trypanosoma melophagium]|uniref:BRCT domain n=1 Tax=Trypanosoma melophagium TaxID=715481 RepID=UPI00351A0BEC|nr:BRCT domain [Trypanosoma melophagium]